MGASDSGESASFASVFEFCGKDKEMYMEIIVEIKLSVDNLKNTLEQTNSYDIDAIKFITHKMKSTFRIMNDDIFRQLLDDFTEFVVKADLDGTKRSRVDLVNICEDYHQSLSAEIDKLS